MRLTIIGCGDAFGAGGRANTCFLLASGSSTIALDFGVTSLVELKRRGIDHEIIDAIVISHLHGDHFGGIPFLLLDAQFVRGRDRALTIIGPPGTKARLTAALEVLFPGCTGVEWRFPLKIFDLACSKPRRFQDFRIESREVVHPSGAPATALRIASKDRLLAFSGDTSWTDMLVGVADGADLFLVECHQPEGNPYGHGSFETISANRDRLRAKQIMLTHMGEAMLRRTEAAQAAGFLVADDGMVLDL